MPQVATQIKSCTSWINRTNRLILLESDLINAHKAKYVLYLIHKKGENTNFHFWHIPNIKITLMSDKGRKKHNKSWSKHKRDILEIVELKMDKIEYLDTLLNGNNEITLRDIITRKKHSNGSNLVHHVDKVSSFENVTGITKRVVVYPENFEEMQTLLCIINLYGYKRTSKRSKKWFTGLSIERHNEVRFDEEKGFITKDEKMMDKILNANARMITDGLLEGLQTPMLDENKNNVPARADVRSYYSCSSSIRSTSQEQDLLNDSIQTNLASGISLDNEGSTVLMLTASAERERGQGNLGRKRCKDCQPNMTSKCLGSGITEDERRQSQYDK